MFSKSCKHRKIDPYGLGALLLIIMAVILRVILIFNGWPPTDSDEANVGLQALHIFNRGEWPIFLYGQNYMGTIQVYLGACFFFLFGPSLFALRLGLVVLYAGFLLAVYLLARLLYSKGVALIVLLFVCLGSSETLTLQLLAVGGALETQLFGALSLLLASWLALSFDPDKNSREQLPEGVQRKRLIGYGCLGGVIGLGLWSHLLVLPFVGTSLLLLLLFCRRELWTKFSLFGVLGFLVGLFPCLLFNIQHLSDNSLMAIWNIHNTGGVQMWLAKQNPWLLLLGAVVISIPTATGASPLCTLSAQPNQWIHQFTLSCVAFQGCWGLGVIILRTLAASAIIKEMQEYHRAFSASGSPADKEHLVRCTGRLMLVVSVDLTLLAYVTSPGATITPIPNTRYLVGLLVATPAIVGYLWPRFSAGQLALTHLTTIWRVLKVAKIVDIIKICALCFISAILIMGTINAFQHIPDAQQRNQREDALINALLGLHTPHIYSDYWTCNRLIFASDERIICGSLNTDLTPGFNRYPLYWQIMQKSPDPVYVFDIEKDNATGIAEDKAFADGIVQNQTFAQSVGGEYHHLYVAGYVIYLPK